MRVSSINDDITWFCTADCDDCLDEVVDSFACLEGFGELRKVGLVWATYLDKNHHSPWLLELGNKFL
jgi:hypothetical protein